LVNISVTLRKTKSKAARNSLRSWDFLLATLGLEVNLESSHPYGMLCYAGD